eukprot:m.363802 g.363802  ORF g.363802 m.363802 type:complete len:149 (-) comp16654_c0_seq35:320-766(-)
MNPCTKLQTFSESVTQKSKSLRFFCRRDKRHDITASQRGIMSPTRRWENIANHISNGILGSEPSGTEIAGALQTAWMSHDAPVSVAARLAARSIVKTNSLAGAGNVACVVMVQNRCACKTAGAKSGCKRKYTAGIGEPEAMSKLPIQP